MRKSLQAQLLEAQNHQRPLPTRALVHGEWHGVKERGELTAMFKRVPDAEMWAWTDFEGRGIRSTVEIVSVEVKEVAS